MLQMMNLVGVAAVAVAVVVVVEIALHSLNNNHLLVLHHLEVQSCLQNSVVVAVVAAAVSLLHLLLWILLCLY